MQAQEIQREMQHVRANLGTDVRNLAQQARDSTDWRHYVRSYPWVCLGAVAAAGYLLVPYKKRAQAAQPAAVGVAGGGRSPPASSAAGITSAITAMVVRAVASA